MKPIPEEVERLRAEAAGASAAEPSPVDDVGARQRQQLQGAAVMLAYTVGNVICQRAGVAVLETQEVEALGLAIAELASVYNFELDPRTGAWLGFGLAVSSVAGPRIIAYQRRPRRESPPPAPEAEEPKAEPVSSPPAPSPSISDEAVKDGAAFHGPA